MSTEKQSAALNEALRGPWRSFLEVYDPLRPDLYRYCRHLTRSPWDAEDLAQDVLARAFSTLASMQSAPENPRAWLFRVASNLWIDRTRRAEHAPREAVTEKAASTHDHADSRATREAAGTLIGLLSPHERAAVVLKDALDFSLEEVAESLSTTVGAVKTALHRGRGKLKEAPIETPEAPRAVLDAFCAAFNARDLDRLTGLLLETVEVEVVGAGTSYGKTAARNGALTGMLFGSEHMANAATTGGMESRFSQRVLAVPARAEVRIHRGEALLLSWYAHEDGEFVRAITRAEVDGDGIAKIRNYFFTPEFLTEICRELDVPFRSNGTKFCA